MVSTFTGLFFSIKGNDTLKNLKEFLSPSRYLGNMGYFYYLLNRWDSSPHGRVPLGAYRLLIYKMGQQKITTRVVVKNKRDNK